MSDRNVVKLETLPKMPIADNRGTSKLRVAAYARVSKDHEEQQTSFEAQVDYYTSLITANPQWQFVKVYADEGISGCRADKRSGFQEMIADCDNGLIDLILTKSVSRFARNTVDSITAIRHLRELNIGVMFEKENIMSLDSKGEFMLTLMSSLAQEESRSISENVRWGQRKRFADGKSSLAYSRFLGYDQGTDKYEMVVNEEQARIVRNIFRMCLQGHTPHTIAMKLTEAGIPTPGGCEKWNQQTVRRMLKNEKYKGDALLQKDFTVDFLTKRTKKNCGELPQYYVEGDHEAIIAPWLFDYIQEYIEEKRRFGDTPYHTGFSGLRMYSGRIICGKCGMQFGPRPWHSTSYNNPVWQCRNRFNESVNCKTVNVYDAYLHVITHGMAIERIKQMPKVTKNLMSCVEEVVGTDRMESIKLAIKKILQETTWKLWSDEDDLVLVIEQIIVNEDGSIAFRWIDGKETRMQMETFKPSLYFSEKKVISSEVKATEKPSVSLQDKRHKDQVLELRKIGTSYGQIAKTLDMNLNTVKAICRRNREKEQRVFGNCLYCGKPVEQIAKRKQKKFCCDKCRNQWWNEHLDKVEKKAYYEISCKNCGKVFTVYGDRQRKYCCRECYIEDRFGRN